MAEKTGTVGMTRHGRKTVQLYNSKTGEYVRVSDWAAEIKLKNDHVKNGGRYCKISEIDTYIIVPKPLPKAIKAEAKPTTKPEPTNESEAVSKTEA